MMVLMPAMLASKGLYQILVVSVSARRRCDISVLSEVRRDVVRVERCCRLRGSRLRGPPSLPVVSSLEHAA
jgi:hypothetical protein